MTAFVGAKLGATYTAAQLKGAEAYAVPGIGDVYVSHDNKTYRFVQYNGGAGAIAAVAGNVTYLYAPAGVSTGASTVVTSDLSDSAELGAGVLQAAPASGDYCWIQVKGVATLNTALTAGADGDPLTPSGSTDGTLDTVAAATDAVCAYAIDASAKIVMCAFPH
ncbi:MULTISPECIES: hypothetical protein [unclassified Mesorhizobium]|uniref:hypothetical protein n=1 Tax=unclassified Mesorhizobium TaxID=325217 RepID=UPI00112BEC12|nr:MULTISPECIES: hypothetical protein [unclassified Mesorhizobium]TPJ38185.1 hypothetical protein FJ437_30885 [Mesorhizobium sp. B2-6-6]MCA0000956.1 hypothetical protein [Mesorhizobium sp. B264B2A]MCA0004705.1 hypothetical protein [Mesorhizobium sp. B264B1B]MCA0019096.1 hypothetical protein [Mesorhizobium sp. B264B1A]TPJ56017.1 hypothetical protein FJ462_32800 [Mesorhizobium sp. B2-6-7]